ncbi:MAG TPA: hypothetical protein VMB80_08020 [Candidatus Acidoferrum sp.]|nr:hypothetical protein [Candidatus Acidoferrum sp.]
MKATLAVKFPLLVILSLATVWMAGCASTPPVDWNSRVGHYTYDQAATDLGQPDRQARLSDGKLVAKWFAEPQTGPALNTGMSYYGSTGFTSGQNMNPGWSNRYLQLTFGTNGVLADWSKNY